MQTAISAFSVRGLVAGAAIVGGLGVGRDSSLMAQVVGVKVLSTSDSCRLALRCGALLQEGYGVEAGREWMSCGAASEI